MAFPLVSLLLCGVEYDRPSLNPSYFLGENFLLLNICDEPISLFRN